MTPTPPENGSARALVFLVIAMGVLIVIGVAVIVATVISRHASHVAAAPVQEVAAVWPIEFGARLEHVGADAAGNLILQIAEPNGDQRIVVWSTATGVVRARLTLTHPASP